MKNKSSLMNVTNIELAIKEKKLSDLADDLRELAEQQRREIEALQELLVDYVRTTKKIIEEFGNAE